MSGASKLTLTMVAALMVQTITALLWAGAAANRLEQLESRLATMSSLEVRAARLEEQTEHLRRALVRIEAKLDRVLIQENS